MAIAHISYHDSDETHWQRVFRPVLKGCFGCCSNRVCSLRDPQHVERRKSLSTLKECAHSSKHVCLVVLICPCSKLTAALTTSNSEYRRSVTADNEG